MAVKVLVDPDKGSGTVQHGGGDAIEVHDGHLMVSDAGNWIAIYAPGKWQRAEVTK